MKLWAREVSYLRGAQCCPPVFKIYYPMPAFKALILPQYLYCQSTGLVFILETVLELALFWGEISSFYQLCSPCVTTQDSGLFLRDVGKEPSLWRDFVTCCWKFFRIFCRAFYFKKPCLLRWTCIGVSQ